MEVNSFNENCDAMNYGNIMLRYQLNKRIYLFQLRILYTYFIVFTYFIYMCLSHKDLSRFSRIFHVEIVFDCF